MDANDDDSDNNSIDSDNSDNNEKMFIIGVEAIRIEWLMLVMYEEISRRWACGFCCWPNFFMVLDYIFPLNHDLHLEFY